MSETHLRASSPEALSTPGPGGWEDRAIRLHIGKQEACLGHVRSGRDARFSTYRQLADGACDLPFILPFGQWRARETHGESG